MKTRRRCQRTLCVVAMTTAALSMAAVCSAYTTTFSVRTFGIRQASTRLGIFAPPGSGYAMPDDEESPFPETYEPMMEYPGTMRPGRTPEDQPYCDLPIGDDDDWDPVPWPHFQQIEWHHRWEPPHEHPIPMEEFIELQGRWATPEMEAAMRAGARRDVRQAKQQAEEDKKTTVVMDDEEDEVVEDVPVELGDGIFGQLGSVAEEAVTAEAVAPPSEKEVEAAEAEDVDDFDDFLLDLGLDTDVGDEPLSADTDKSKKKGDSKDKVADAVELMMDEVDDGEDVNLDLDLGLLDDEGDEEETGLGLALDDDSDDITALVDDDEDDVDFDEDEEDLVDDDGMTMVPLDDFAEGDSDSLEGEGPFDDGGFDYDDGDMDMDGGDDW